MNGAFGELPSVAKRQVTDPAEVEVGVGGDEVAPEAAPGKLAQLGHLVWRSTRMVEEHHRPILQGGHGGQVQ